MRGPHLTQLYTKLAPLYHEIYQSIFNYNRDFRQFHAILKKHDVKRVLELGCGTGNLAKYFLAAGYDYTGMDIARPMLRIAQEENPEARFIHGDMCRFSFPKKFDAVVIGGRSFTYMTTNRQVMNALRCIRRALRPGGILIFDNFDAAALSEFTNAPMREQIRTPTKTVTRTSRCSLVLKTGWTWNWDAVYRVKQGRRTETFVDHGVLRSFTRDELSIFLGLCGFCVLRYRKGKGTFMMIAQAI